MTAYTLIDAADRVTGVDLTVALPTTPTASDTFPAGGSIYIRIKTGVTNTFLGNISWPTALDAYGVAKAVFPLNGGVAIPVSSDRIFGPFPAAEFADPSDGQVHVTSASTFAGTTVGYYNIPNG